MIQIKPKQSAFSDKIATQLLARTVETELHSTSTSIFCELRTANDEALFSMFVQLPEEIYSLWGVDDKIIEDYILAELKLEKL